MSPFMTGLTSLSEIGLPSGPVSAVVNGRDDAPVVLVLAHGAGADMHSDFMSFVADGVAAEGFCVCRFNFPYAEAGRRSPDKQAVLEATWRAAIERIGGIAAERPVVVGGKSVGGRIASHVVAAGEPAAGLVFLGYPLHPPGKPERIRAEHLGHIKVPMLFVEGTRDPFCPLETLEGVVASLDADVLVESIPDGDHSFRVRSASGRSTRQSWAEVTSAVARWLGRFVE
jgi:predicted alpha/beta-hydrolase family hydrolase